MNSLERVLAAVSFQQPDRTPVIPQVFGHAAVLAGVELSDYLRDGELLARCQLRALDHYGYDAVFALMDVNVESEAMGSVLSYRSHQYPFIQSYVLNSAAGLGALRLPDPQRSGRMPEILKAARLLRKEAGSEVVVAGCVLGPMTLAVQLLGAETALYTAIDDPELFSQVLDFCVEVAILFGIAQLDAGVHVPIVFEPSATPDVIPPSFYRELVLPRLAQIFSAFQHAGAAANWLHTAGPVTPILPYYPRAGVSLANIDYSVSPQDAIQALPATCLNGNIKPLAFIDATPEAIAAVADQLIHLFAARRGFILSSGCEIPPESRPENIRALVDASIQAR